MIKKPVRLNKELMKVIFDTNAYRNLAKTIFRTDNDAENRAKILRLAEKEQAKNIRIELSYHVLLELLGHLSDENDSSYEDCKIALKLAVLHCGIPTIADSLNLTILKYSEDLAKINLCKEAYKNIWITSVGFVTNGQSDLFNKNVEILRNELNWIKQGISKGFKLMIIEFNNGRVKKKPLLISNHINNEDYFSLLSRLEHCDVIPDLSDAIGNEDLGLLKNYIEEKKIILDEIIEKHFVGFAHTNTIINNKYGDKVSMGKEFPNNFLDIEICFLVDRFSDSILVTNDGFSSTNANRTKIHATFENIGFSSRVKDLNSYLEFIELPEFKI